MKLLKIGKYPPIEGGISSQSYWISRGLGKKDEEIDIVTNSLETEGEYRERITDDFEDNYQPENIEVFNTDPFIKNDFIPYSPEYTQKLISLSLKVIEKDRPDVIVSNYLLPYGTAASHVSRKTNIPHVLKHAGSDITRLLNSRNYNTVLENILKESKSIITVPGLAEFFSEYKSEDQIFEAKKSINTEIFSPEIEGIDLDKWFLNRNAGKDFLYLGKLRRSKGILNILRSFKQIDEEFNFYIVGNGPYKDRIISYIKENNLEEKVFIENFMPPWKVPHLLRSMDCVFVIEEKFNVGIHSSRVIKESMGVGTPVITNKKPEEYGCDDKI
ncbi:MAG: glycosyltransferase, partial [Candidatus Aenigmatarchaeota archaeon]